MLNSNQSNQLCFKMDFPLISLIAAYQNFLTAYMLQAERPKKTPKMFLSSFYHFLVALQSWLRRKSNTLCVSTSLQRASSSYTRLQCDLALSSASKTKFPAIYSQVSSITISAANANLLTSVKPLATQSDDTMNTWVNQH